MRGPWVRFAITVERMEVVGDKVVGLVTFRAHGRAGIVTDRDLALTIVAERRDPQTKNVEDVMTHNVVTCRADDDLQKALAAMAKHQLRRIPVVDNDYGIVGIIAQADVATRVDQPEKTAEVVKEISQANGK